MSTPVTYINKKDLVGKLMEQWKTDMSFDELLNVIASAESIVIDEKETLKGTKITAISDDGVM